MVHPTNLVILFQGDHLLISYRARDTFALCTIADVSSLVNISRKNVQCWWPTFSLQETTTTLSGSGTAKDRHNSTFNRHTCTERTTTDTTFHHTAFQHALSPRTINQEDVFFPAGRTRPRAPAARAAAHARPDPSAPLAMPDVPATHRPASYP